MYDSKTNEWDQVVGLPIGCKPPGAAIIQPVDPGAAIIQPSDPGAAIITAPSALDEDEEIVGMPFKRR
jgi:hypothetical protein